MLINFVRAIIIYLIVLIVMRLMGKREIGQLQPFELAISIMIADLASIPMTDPGVPIFNGIVPILGLLAMHLVITVLNIKSVNIRKITCGKPTVLVYRGKIDEEALKRERKETMKKEAIITISIVLLILLAEWLTQGYTHKAFAEIEDNLTQLKEEILQTNANSEQLINKTEQIAELWESKQENLSYYLEHNELEKVNTQIVLIKGYLESDSPQDAIPDLEEGLYIIEHIKEKEAFKLKNIL